MLRLLRNGDKNDPVWLNICFPNRRVELVYGDDNVLFDTGHVSQRSCNSKVQQKSTDTDTGSADLLDLDEKKSNMRKYLTS